MITRFSFFVAVGLITISCGSKERGFQTDNISGVYVRQYSFKVIHPERGDTIGTRTVRDTIFIRQKDQGYEVSNNKWRSNDYDEDGWKNMDHAEDRSMLTYQANFDVSDSSLDNKVNMTALYWSTNRRQLFKTKKRVDPYEKIK